MLLFSSAIGIFEDIEIHTIDLTILNKDVLPLQNLFFQPIP